MDYRKTSADAKIWSKEEVKKVIELWPTKRYSEIRNELNVSDSALSYLVANLRKMGVDLPKRPISSSQNKQTIAETLKEMGIIK